MTENEIGTVIISKSIEIHKTLGPGLLESVYEIILIDELESVGLSVKSQLMIPVYYKTKKIDAGFRADLIIEDRVIVELKSVEKLNNAHRKQIQTYLKLSGLKLGYLLNFGEALFKDGIVRAVNGL